MSHTPYHHAQMTQSLPGWSKALHSEHASRILARLRKDYQDAEGNAYLGTARQTHSPVRPCSAPSPLATPAAGPCRLR